MDVECQINNTVHTPMCKRGAARGQHDQFLEKAVKKAINNNVNTGLRHCFLGNTAQFSNLLLRKCLSVTSAAIKASSTFRRRHRLNVKQSSSDSVVIDQWRSVCPSRSLVLPCETICLVTRSESTTTWRTDSTP